jgi:hypothetical protein
MGKNRRQKSHRMPVDLLLKIARQVCDLAGVDLEQCWMHGARALAAICRKRIDLTAAKCRA